jgi:hypothetical protein
MFLVCFICFAFFIARLNSVADGLYDNSFVQLIVCHNRDSLNLALPMPKSSFNPKPIHHADQDGKNQRITGFSPL